MSMTGLVLNVVAYVVCEVDFSTSGRSPVRQQILFRTFPRYRIIRFKYVQSGLAQDRTLRTRNGGLDG